MIYVSHDTLNILYFVTIILFFTSLLVQALLQSKMNKYAETHLKSGKSGAEVAAEMLKDNNIYDVEILEVDGILSDHYNPINKTLNLSSAVYNGVNIGAAAVAAHECGHALQYKDGYGPIKLRNGIAKVASIGNTIGYIALAIGFLASITGLVYVGVALMFFAIIFQLITLPVEFNASKRARKELLRLGLISESEAGGVRKMLNAAGFTYIAGLLSSLLEIVRLLSYVRKK